MLSFISTRFKRVLTAIKGMFILIKTEASIQSHLLIFSFYLVLKSISKLAVSFDAQPVLQHALNCNFVPFVLSKSIRYGLTNVLNLENGINDWIKQIMIFGFIISIEALNTGIEKICDFIKPDYNKRIGFIKDISAGAVSFAVIASLIAIVLIYYPYLF